MKAFALALVETERAGGLHWIVFTAHRNGEVTVGDSLHAGLQEMSLDQLSAGPLLTYILLAPDVPAPGSPFHGAHARGLGAMLFTTWQSAPLPTTLALLAVVALVTFLARKRGRRTRSRQNR